MDLMIWLAVAALGTLAMLLAARRPAQPSVTPGTVVKSDKARVRGLTASDLGTLSQSSNEFALALYQQLRARAGSNFMFSPHSIRTALAMTYAGARGSTAKEMASAARFSLPDAHVHTAFNAADQLLARRAEGAGGLSGKGFRLNVVNAIWGQSGYEFLPDFLDTLALNYGAGVRLLDFQQSPEPARLAINQWVAEQTEQRIKDLLAQGTVVADTSLVLTNAIYFNAAWLGQFDKKATQDDSFNLLDGQTVTVPLMRRSGSYGYAAGDGWQALVMPYEGAELSMVVLLPAAGKFAAYEAALNAAQVETTLNALNSRRVNLSLPRWKFDSSFSLKEPLEALGMQEAFVPRTADLSGMKEAFVPRTADLSGMDGTRNLFISAILHKTFVAVDEAGTEAAAATAEVVAYGRMGKPVEPVVFKADRPFIYLIRDRETGAVLFMGRVTNPA